ncbi:MAG: aminotransferase class V-fold PLP-dependent enzyme [Anaerolineales bacterium]|nr:aminotransferase class V-fold PLP-dependent enzyme [Anaerolineales bacterium]
MSSNSTFADLFAGLDVETPLLDGSHRRYINFDNAASTPPLKAVQRAVNEFMTYYSSVHRGTGFKSQLATHIYEEAREITMRFVGADPQTHTCIYGKNTTEALNKLARRFPFTPERNVVLTSGMEHHSNDLPWRKATETVHIRLHPDGRLDMADFDAKLAEYGDRLALVAITGASNVTGYLNPVHKMAEKVHALGAQIAVDCAQLAPHRQVNMRPLDDPTHLDFVTISAHKLYAPYGTGALIGRRDIFEEGDPDMVGGGTVSIVTLGDVIWAEPPDRDEAGSPNTAGAVALAGAICQLQSVGMDTVAKHEAELTAYTLKTLATVPGFHPYGDTDPENSANRLGVIPFNLDNKSHFWVAAVLGHEFGIGVRNGCFCAHPYILHLLGLTSEEAHAVRDNILAENKRDMPGLVRVSFGLYNTTQEVDMLAEALDSIAHGKYYGNYIQDIPSGEFHPEGWKPNFKRYFSF